MRLKKILALILSVVIVLGTMSFPVFAEETDLTISTADELKAFAADVNAGNSYEGKTVVLANDINMEWNAVVIGTKASPFKGTFDGQGYTVSNISIYEDGSDNDYFADSDDCIGLFGVINTPAVIKNVTVQDPYIVGSAYVGGIVGMGYTGTIENCHVTGEIDIEGFYMVGGINGHGYATISNCSVIGADGWDYSYVGAAYKEANLEGDNVGGIVGHNGEHNDIIGCEVRNITVSGTRKVGGIVGIAAQNSDVAGCKVSNVTVETTATAEYANSNAKTMSIGGLVGQYQNNGANDGVISGCEVSGLTFANENGVTVSAGALTGGRRGTSNSVLAPSETVTAVGNTVSDVEGATVEYLEPVSTAVAKVNGTDYASFDAAIAAAKGLSGDVTVEIYEKVTLTMSDAPLSGKFDSISFVGKTDAAEIYLDIQGYITAGGKKVAFEDLKLSKAEGGSIYDAACMNLAFGVYNVAEVTYTNCVFLNGAYAAAGVVTFTDCVFYRSWDRYGLWTYGDADIIVEDCTFADIRGVKMYSATTNLTVKNTDFTAADNKPAIVLTYGESVTLENNTYPSKGVFELDLDGVPNGTPVTSTDTITCVNDNGVCGVLVDGKIYTTAAAAAAVATAGSEVTLLHNSAETVEFAEGVVLNKNGFDAANVTVKTSGVAKVGDKTFASVLEAVTYAVENKATEVKLLADSHEVMPTDVEILLKADLAITADAPVTAAFYNSGTSYDFVIDCEGYGDYDFTIGENVTFVLEDRVIWVGYYGSNIDVQVNGTLSGSQIWAGGDVYVNATGTLKSTGEAFVIRRGKTVFMDGGKIEANYFNILAGNIYAKNGAVIESGALWIDNTGGYTGEGAVSITLWDSTLTCQGNLKASSDSYVNIDVYNSNVKILDNHGYGVSVLDEETTLYVNGESGSLTINKGINNSGTIDVYDGGKLAIPANATVTNNGDILIDATSTIEGPAEMNVATEVAGKTVEYVDGKYVVVAVPAVAKIGATEYATLEEAAAEAVAGDTITLLDDVTLTANLTLPAGITFNGNGKTITGAEVWAGGNLTFEGYTKMQVFNAGYEKPVITIGEGATLEMTSGRMVIGHGATFNITGNVADAKTANVADLTPSLIAAGASFTGAGVNFNVTNAYVKFTAYCSSKNSNANGTFNINVTNSIWNQTGSLVFSEPTNGKDPTFNFNVKDSVLNSTSHLVFAVTKGDIVFDNSNVNEGVYRQLENRSTLTIKNGSVVYASVQTSSNAKNPGTTIVENATYNTTGEFSGSDVGTGTLIVKKGANVTMGKITKANIVVDATDMAAGDEVGLTANLSALTGTVSAINNSALEAKVVDGKVVLVEKPVATVTDAEGNVTSYADLQSALKALTAGATLTLLDDVTITEAWDNRYTGAKITVPVTIDGNGKTIKFTNTVYDGGNYMSAFRFEADAAVKNLTIDMSEALSGFAGRFRAISAMADLTVDNCKFIGNGIENNTRAIIFGEGAGANAGNLKISISNSTFEGWRRGVSDNENAQDVQSVAVTGNTFTNAGVAVSATDAVTFTNNTVSGAYVSVTSYTDSETLKVVATGNTLEANNGENKNVIDVVTDDVEAQADFYLPNAGLAGSGTEADPFLINNVEELILFRDSVNAEETKYNAAGVYVALAADIDLAGIDWSVNIGDDAGTTFDGIFDGKNHKILNLGATENAEKGDGYVCTGLFGAIYGSAQIKNLTIENVNISAAYDGNNAGIVVGWVYNGTGSIENVTVTGDIKVDATGIYGAGAIVGYSYYNTNFTIKDCKVIANEGSYIKASAGVGGIIGYSNGDNLVNCEVSGLEISAKGLVGGIAGIALGTSNVATAKVSDVTLTASSANWANSAAVAIGTIAAEGLSVSGVTYDNVNVDKLVGSDYAEKPTDVVPAVQAMVGNKYYTTFKQAFEVAKSGDTITLLEDVTLDEILYIGKSLTINGNGHKITSAQNRVIRVTTGGVELTINNLNVVSTATVIYPNDIRGISLDANISGVKLTLNNCSVDFTDATADDWSYGVNVAGNSSNHVITINGGTYEGANAINVWGNDHTIVIDGATITSTYMDSELYHGYCVNAEETGVEITIKNTTFNGSNAKAVKEGSTFVGENNIDNTKVYVVPVAKIGDTKYGTLEEAIAAAQNGDVITLIGDVEYVNVASASNKATSISIPAGKKFTLDLNGYTISGENNVNGSFSFITICAGADITIDDTSDAKTGKITYNATRETPNENHEGHTIKNMGSLALNGGKIENSTSLASNGYEKCVTTAIDNVSSGGPIASFVMNGGVVVSDTYFAVRSNVYANTAATEKTAVTKINGGTVYGLHFCDWGTTGLDYEVAIGDGAVIESSNYVGLTDQAFRLAIGKDSTSKVTLDISENAQINGVIYGAGAKNGNLYYTNNRFQTAFDEAQDGDVITLLGDITLKGKTIKVPAGLEVTLDLNGKKIVGTDTNTAGNFYLIDNRGTLTVTGDGTITLVAETNRAWDASSVVIANNPGGKLTVENGTIEHLGGTDMAYALDNLTNGKGTYAETIVNGGTIKSTYRAVRQFLNGAEAQNILTINGGMIEGTNKSVFFHDPSTKANNGTLTVSENATLNGDVYLFVTAGSTEWPVNVSIAASAVNGEVTSKNVPEGYEVVDNNGVYGVQLVEKKDLFTFTQLTTSLETSLVLNVYVSETDVVGEGYYAVVQHDKPEGVVETIIPYQDWVSTTISGEKVIRYKGIAAKEMGDQLTITIYDADGQAVSRSLGTSLKAYAIGMMNMFIKDGQTDSLWLPALTDMLNYGAAAQQMFGYKTDALVTEGAETFQQYASPDYSLSREGCYGEGTARLVSLSLNETISVNAYFADVTSGMYATYSYTDHNGKYHSGRVEYGAFITNNNDGTIVKGPQVDIAIADADALITVQMFNQDGEQQGKIVYSFNGYLKGMIESDEENTALYPALAKFAASAKAAFAK